VCPLDFFVEFTNFFLYTKYTLGNETPALTKNQQEFQATKAPYPSRGRLPAWLFLSPGESALPVCRENLKTWVKRAYLRRSAEPGGVGRGAALTVAGAAIGLKKLDYEAIPRVAILSAAFFVASLIHVPVGPVGLHLVLNGLMGLLLGWLAFPAILIALFLQALLFQFGGLTVLGVNAFTMAAPAVVCFCLSGLSCAGVGNSPWRRPLPAGPPPFC
jgi:hypothetical protein